MATLSSLVIHGKFKFEVSAFLYFLIYSRADRKLEGCSIWAVELIRREILKLEPEAKINAILIDFFLYDLAKEIEKDGEEAIPHHRTRSIWY